MYIVYLLRSVSYKKTYIGITNNLNRRLSEHNKLLHSYTKRYAPWIVIYTENCQNRIIARNREKYFKSASGRKWIKKYIFSN